jgi:hypothetical protein
MHFLKQGWAAVAFGIAIGWGAVLALDAVDQARTRSKLQQIADDAAISGVLALASNTQRGAYVAQHEATVAVTNQIERKIDRAGILVRPSSADSAVSVEVSAPLQSPLQALLHNGKPVTVIGAANYLPPAPRSTRKPPTWLADLRAIQARLSSSRRFRRSPNVQTCSAFQKIDI